MIGAFLDKIDDLFDRRFILAYWAPLFVVLTLAVLGGLAVTQGIGPLLKTWSGLDPLLQVILPLAALIAFTVLAYILQAMTAPLIRLYEGYWPAWLHGLTRHAIAEQQARRAALLKVLESQPEGDAEAALRGLHQAGAYRQLYLGYPRKAELVRATRLGNALTAAEEYAYQVYRLDTILWWPRLSSLLPEPLRGQIDAALTPMIALVNLSFLLTLLALVGGPALVAADLSGASQPWWLFLLVFAGGLLLARLSYEAAVTQAGDYGGLLRVAFDLHRHKVLEEMHIERPDNLREERRLWDALNQWVYRYVPPWESRWPLDFSQFPEVENFYYDTYEPPKQAPADKAQRVELTLAGSHTLNVRQGETDE
jgi:hypothetical protein